MKNKSKLVAATGLISMLLAGTALATNESANCNLASAVKGVADCKGITVSSGKVLDLTFKNTVGAGDGTSIVKLNWNGSAQSLVDLSKKDDIKCSIAAGVFVAHVNCNDITTGKNNILWGSGGGLGGGGISGDVTFSAH